MYNFNQWLKLREAYELDPFDWENDDINTWIANQERKRRGEEMQSSQQQSAPQQNPQQGQQQPAQRQPFSFSKALGIRPDQAEMKEFPNHGKTGLKNKVEGSPGFGRWFYIQMGLSDAEKAKIVNSWKPEFATGTAQNNAPQNQGTNPQSGQQFTQKQLDARSLRLALTDLDNMAKMAGDTGASSMLYKLKSTVEDGNGRLDPNLQNAILAAKNSEDPASALKMFKNAYAASARLR